MTVGAHRATIATQLKVDGQTLQERLDDLTPENRINPKMNVAYTNGTTEVTIPDVDLTAANIAYLYLFSSLADCDVKFKDGTNTKTIHIHAGVPYIWTPSGGSAGGETVDNPMASATPGAITDATSATVINLGTKGGVSGVAYHVTTQLTVDIGIVNA